MIDLQDPHTVLRQAVRGNRALGLVMVFIGADFCLQAGSDFLRRPQIDERVLVVSFSLFLLAPGILYLYAAFALKRREMRAAHISLCTAICQSIPSLVAVAIAYHLGMTPNHYWSPRIGVPRVARALIIPLLVGAFFAPALLVQTWKLWRAVKAIRLLPPSGHAFEAISVLPLAALPFPQSPEPTPRTSAPSPPPPPYS